MKINWFKININEVLEVIAKCIFWGEKLSLSNVLIYLKQGMICEDCDLNYWNCICNDSEEYLNNPIRKYSIKIALEILSKENLNRLINKEMVSLYSNYFNEEKKLIDKYLKIFIKFIKEEKYDSIIINNIYD